MVEAAHRGGAAIRKHFRQALEVTEKSMASDQQTQADLQSEHAIVGYLAQHCPDTTIFAEESAREGDLTDAPTFVIDPLDGTNNFVLGIPYFAVSIGLMVDREIVAGVIYHPILDETYSAEKGQGAFLDGKPLQVSSETDPHRLTIGWCGAYGTDFVNFINLLRLQPRPKRRTNTWCPTLDLCLLAQGKIEAFIIEGAQLYDFCAGKLIAREAGATVTDLSGNPETEDSNRFFIVGNSPQLCGRLSLSLERT